MAHHIVVEVIKIVAPLAVALVMFAQGLAISPRQVVGHFRERPWLMARSLLAVLVVVPVVAVALILALKPPPAVAIGLAILVSCPPAPLMLSSATKRGKADAAFMASLHLSLATLALVTVPAALYLISLPLGFHASVALPAMAWILARTILIPIALGLAVHAVFPGFAGRGGPVLAKVGMAALALVVLIVLVALFPVLLKTDAWSYLVIALVAAASLAVGQLLGPSDPHQKTSLAVECGVRHPALAITIGAANFGMERALPVLVPCVLTLILVATIYMVVRGKTLPAVKLDGAGAIS